MSESPYGTIKDVTRESTYVTGSATESDMAVKSLT